MKTKILSLAAAVLVSIASISGSNPTTKIYTNIIGNTKECIMIDNQTSNPIKRIVYEYDTKGIIQERCIYDWDSAQGWINTQKCSYKYDNEKLTTIIYTEWDKKMTAWSTTSQYQIHTYDTDGKLLAVEKREVKDNLMAAH